MKITSRREFFARAAALAAASALPGFAEENEPAERRLNVVLLMSDEHNPFYSSVAGHRTVSTPNMARLAARGTVFENAYCPSPLCMPSRSAFVSGRRVHSIQTYNNCNAVPFDYPSYGQVLRDQGVHSVHMGKMDVYRPSAELGFSELALAGDRSLPGDTNIRRHPLSIRADAAVRARQYGVKSVPFRHDDAIMEAALRWLDTQPGTIDGPWTLTVNIEKPHFPHYVTQDLWDLYPNGGDLPEYGRDIASAEHPYAQDLRRHFQTDKFTEEDVRGLRRGYLGCVTYVDQQIGRLLDALDRNGLTDNTVFIYTSDHGEMLGKFGLWWKCSLYEDSVRVPVIAAGPGFEGGRRVKTPVDLLDVQATLFAATRTRRPADWVGQPLQEIPDNDPDRAVFAEYHGHGTRASGYVIRKGYWKLIWCAEAPHQLFNLAEDPGELKNLAKSNPGKFTELEQDLRAVCNPETENRRAENFIEQQLEAIRKTLEPTAEA